MPGRRYLPARRGRVTVFFAAALAAAALAVAGTVAAQLQLPGTPLTNDPGQDLRPAYSPDGQLIAFQSSRSGNYNLFLMDASGGNQRFLTQDTFDNRRPAWSADGQWIAFDSDRSGSRDVWVIDVNGANRIQITDGAGQETFPSFSPDGRQLAYYGYSEGQLDLWRVDLEAVLAGGALPAPQRITNGLADERANQCTFACHSAGWSPDGRQLVYTSGSHTQVWVVGVDGSDPHPVKGAGVIEHFPQWTADGRILFLSERITDERDPVNDIWVMDADGDNLSLLFEAIPHGGPLEFQAGSSTVIYHSPRTGNFDIYTTILGQEPIVTAAPIVTPVAELNLEAPTPTAAPLPATQAQAVVQPTAAPVVAAAVTNPGLPWVGLGVMGLVILAGGGLLLSQRRRRPPANGP